MKATTNAPAFVFFLVAAFAAGFLYSQYVAADFAVTRSAEPVVQPGEWSASEPCRSDLCIDFGAHGTARVFSSTCDNFRCRKFEAQIDAVAAAELNNTLAVVKRSGAILDNAPPVTPEDTPEGEVSTTSSRGTP